MTRTREQRSLFGELIDWLLAPLLLVWPLSMAAVWLVAQGIANRPYDRELGELARTVARQVVVQRGGATPQVRFALNAEVGEALRSDDEDNIYVQVLGLRGEFIDGDPKLPVPLRPRRRPLPAR